MSDLAASLAGVRGFAALRSHPEAWLVGGAVRDALLGREPVDLDVVTEADALALARSLGTVLEAHDRFGTAEVETPDGHRINVARARAETYGHPGALPDIRPASIAEDLHRRDFSVNAIAVRIGDGVVRAAPGAEDDVRAGVLRVLHPRSFVDDPTRALRLARYAARLGFAIDPETERLARGADLTTISGQRAGNEVLLMLREPDPLAALVAGAHLGLLPGPQEDIVQRAAALAPDAAGVLALATSGVDRSQLDGWGVPAALRDQILATAGDAPDLARRLRGVTKPSEIAQALDRADTSTIALAGAMGAEEPARRYLEQLSHVKLEITGDDLIASGVAEGPGVGERLQRTLLAKLDGEVASGRDAELRAALQ